jgi:hypothetical protein
VGGAFSFLRRNQGACGISMPWALFLLEEMSLEKTMFEKTMLQLLLSMLLLCCAMAEVHAQSQSDDKPEMRVTRSAEITVNGPLDKVFALFTPEGETHWIPSWKYTPIFPTSGTTEQDMVFRTDERTLWTLAVYDPPQRSLYVHASPEEIARIEVECSAIDRARTRVRITYVITAITEDAQHATAHHQSEAEFRKKMDQWKMWLDEYAVKEGWAK